MDFKRVPNELFILADERLVNYDKLVAYFFNDFIGFLIYASKMRLDLFL